uniref:Uncharacterized protein n=1 Tax=Arundo donax TaxID=35708 RepID=A0A0A8Y110_ARUDO
MPAPNQIKPNRIRMKQGTLPPNQIDNRHG